MVTGIVDAVQRGMSILAWIILGLVAGAVAKAIHPGPDPGGIVVTMLIGIVGAFIGGVVRHAPFGAGAAGLDLLWLLLPTLGPVPPLVILPPAGLRSPPPSTT